MTTALDSNVLIDVLITEPRHGLESRARLASLAREPGGLIACEAVFAEIAGGFGSAGAALEFLDQLSIALVPSSQRALYRAGLAWREYATRRPRALRCPRCGTENGVACRQCGEPLTTRQHVIADFLIGAHALEHADRLLTRDRGFYAAAFPELALA